jgi:predicted CXXCH cytochrome family protein
MYELLRIQNSISVDRLIGWTAFILLSTVIMLALAGCSEQPASPSDHGVAGREDQVGSDSKAEVVEFVVDGLCVECHTEEFESWQGSHHDLAMQVASGETVLGNFNNKQFTHFGVTSRFFKEGDRFFVNTEGADGRMADFEIKYTFGVDPLQQYLVEFPGGRLQCLTVSWDTRQKRWFHLYPDERILPEDPLHWTGRYQNWNLMCAECHTTNLRKNYDPETDTYATEFDEINVGCQACHGPGQAHLEWAEQQEEAPENAGGSYGLLVDYSGNDSKYQVDACAPCHSRRARIKDSWRHFGPFLDQFRPETLIPRLYFADGQILDEVYVYGSFLQSKMYEKGVRCTNCHDPHSTKLWVSENAVCTQCHQLQPMEGFPTLLQKDYDTPDHHFHPEGSEGAQCVNCHMPERTYMVVDPRRDHSFRIPRPDLSPALETPNACNGCHTDRSEQWASDAVLEWYGKRKPPEPHYGEYLAAGRSGTPEGEEALALLASRQGETAIVRATALQLLRNLREPEMAAPLKAIGDDEPLIRMVAVANLDRLGAQARIRNAGKLLADPVRLVRIEAARVLGSVPSNLIPANLAPALNAGLEEFRDAQLAMADMPWSHLNLGVLYLDQGKTEEAEESFRIAVRLDPGFVPARVNLANLLNSQGRNDEAEAQLREAIRVASDQGELYYNLGLLVAEMGKLEEAVRILETAANLVPNRARIRYNYALALQQLGRRQDAEKALEEALSIDAEDADIVYALVAFHMQKGELEKALPYAERLVELRPSAPGPRAMLDQIRTQLGR